ncbi:MAG: ATP-binding protein [Kiritimatiellae bacterium]|nr:ATP-binding protein [Kiritimatiellia bacterium]
MKKRFNIAGPCFPDEHYMLPALERLPGIMRIVEQGGYFVLHAARQSGKTTALMALVEAINGKGAMNALYFTVETAQRFTDPKDGIPIIVESMRNAVLRHPLFRDLVRDSTSEIPALRPPSPGLDVKALLAQMSEKSGKPLVVFFDEVDCLSDDTLVTFLRQLRDGYVTRKVSPFPVSVALVGMRDIRDYRARVRSESHTLGSASPFNIITEDLTLGNFGERDVARLYSQHTEETGQVFEPDAVALAWRLTRGQPWLVNALARECVEKIHDLRYDESIAAEDVETAMETIIRARGTHVDSLMERLKEPRVRRVVEPVILGSEHGVAVNDDDYRYALDLGLLREDEAHALVPGNPMYAEIILRYLSNDEQAHFYAKYGQPFWLKSDGSLDMPALMAEFQRFWRENSGADHEVYGYNEATPHLVMMGYLQRVVNGGGRITREMALGSRRLDLCVEFGKFRYAVELKMRRNFSSAESYAQLAGYLDSLGLPEGWMAVFDDDASKPWEERIYVRDEVFGGKTIHVVGL